MKVLVLLMVPVLVQCHLVPFWNVCQQFGTRCISEQYFVLCTIYPNFIQVRCPRGLVCRDNFRYPCVSKYVSRPATKPSTSTTPFIKPTTNNPHAVDESTVLVADITMLDATGDTVITDEDTTYISEESASSDLATATAGIEAHAYEAQGTSLEPTESEGPSVSPGDTSGSLEPGETEGLSTSLQDITTTSTSPEPSKSDVIDISGDTTTPPKTTARTTTTPPPIPQCAGHEFHPGPTCKQYYECVQDWIFWYKPVLKVCAEGQHFSQGGAACIPIAQSTCIN